ncbi:MAG: serine/threonine protein kinase [Pirellulales bacterium]|nr:serine/threonine protein kinase [Pirellulales bacterium]
MSPAVADQNLLFGILAVQMDFATPTQLVAAMNAWVLAKDKPLGKHLVEAGALSDATCELLTALVAKHIEQHGGRVEQSLAAISSTGGLRDDLARVADRDLQTSLARIPAAPPHSPDRHATVATPRPRAEEEARFTILRPHASGGLGRVSVARDGELNREVALKELLDSHADDPDSRARFLQEAEITGGLEHPGVVPIYGLGQYSDGRPFYAMRFIRGDSLRDAIERFHRDADPRWRDAASQIQLRRLLGRMIDVCNAIEYAHSRGVLHRDLKPGNIMLGQYGETLVVDWGLAKATGSAGATIRMRPAQPESTVRVVPEPLLTPSGSAGSAPTQMGSAVGTPAFMSPEQAAGRLDELGPASDVYSLGATLYVLLTGRAPQEDNDLGVVLQRVQRGEFPAPRSVKPVIPRALEAICLKAMAVRPAERYSSPQAMADDLEAWLADEPVAAMPEPLAARTRRWIKKHRALVSTLAGVTLASLAAALLGVAVLTAANQREREAKETAVAAKAEADHQAQRNAELLELARESLDKYESLSKREELQRYGMEELRGSLLEAALDFYETLAKQAGESEQARADRGEALYRVGSTYWMLGRVDDGIAAFEKARDVFEGLKRDFPDNLRYRRGAAVNSAAIGELLTTTQRTAEAAPHLAASRQGLQSVVDAKPEDLDTAAVLAYGWGLEGERLRQEGDFPGANQCRGREVDLLRTALAKTADADARSNYRQRLARALNCRAKIASEGLWQFEPARADHAEARAVYDELCREFPENDDLAFSRAQTIRYQAELLGRHNQAAESRAAFVEAVEALTRLDQRQPNASHYRQELAEACFLLGSMPPADDSEAAGEEQVALIRRAVALVGELAARAPARTDLKLALARYRGNLGVELSGRGLDDEAQAEFDAALELLGALAVHADRNLDNRLAVAHLTYRIASQQAESGRPEDALVLYDQAQGQFESIRAIAPEFSQALLQICSLHLDRASIYLDQTRPADVMRELDAVAKISDDLKDKSDALLLQAGFRTIVLGAATMRQLLAVSIGEGGLRELADSGRFDHLAEQAVAWGKYGGAPRNHFVAADALAYAVSVAAQSPDVAEADRGPLIERLAQQAVAELEAARQGGYIRRRSSFGSLFSSRPTADDLETDEPWAPLKDREDFQELLRQIRSEGSPPMPQPPADSQEPADAPAPQ